MVGLSPPPEGVLVGESIPRENERDDRERAAIAELVGTLKEHPAYHGKPDSQLREIAINRLQKYEVID